MHANSIAAYNSSDFSDRERAILDVYITNARYPLTDREVMTLLGFSDMNSVRPRISKLIDRKMLRDVCDVLDHSTGKTVRACKYDGPKAEPVQQTIPLQFPGTIATNNQPHAGKEASP